MFEMIQLNFVSSWLPLAFRYRCSLNGYLMFVNEIFQTNLSGQIRTKCFVCNEVHAMCSALCIEFVPRIVLVCTLH